MPDTESGEIRWYRPDPRAVIPLDGFHASRSLLRTIRRQQYQFTLDAAFAEVMNACADRKETWITDEFKGAYGELHRLGFGHSIEVWDEKKQTLVGGLYGLSLGGAFFAESMFHQSTDASKAALFFLVESLQKSGFELLEVQFLTEHLLSLGAVEISDSEYQTRLKSALSCKAKLAPVSW